MSFADNIEISIDFLFGGRLACSQHVHGYRFSIDSVLVSHFPVIKQREKVLDIGCGCGVIGLILLYRNQGKEISLTGVEKQPALVDLARKNIADNHYQDYFEIIEADIGKIRQHLKPESFSLVIANPPFYSSGTGRASVNSEVLDAKHLTGQDIDRFVEGASYCVKNRGRVVFVYPAGSLCQLVQAMKNCSIEPKRLQIYYSYPESRTGAKLIVVEGVKNGGQGITVFPPCYIYQRKNGPYTREIEAMFRQ